MSTKPSTSRVEQIALKKTGQKLRYAPVEKIGTVVVDNFYLLGKLTALRFVEWVQSNPDGVVSLPTGKTPEYFIKYMNHFLSNWNSPETRKVLEENSVDPGIPVNMKNLTFVQIDEFYPIDPSHRNSFYYYVDKYYIGNMGFDKKKALLIDCSKIGIPPRLQLEDVWPDGEIDLSLRHRHAKNNQEHLQKQVLEEVDQWCYEHEEKIRTLGGIGFFLGGIGPDGHIAFNILGSDHHSTTRLAPINYETQAAAASDLGGIEVAKKRLCITIGLGTISRNPQCTAIILAAGEVKSAIVRAAVHQSPHIRYPATALHHLPNARFFITQGAARDLTERVYVHLSRLETVEEPVRRKIVIDLAISQRKKLTNLKKKDCIHDRFGKLLIEKSGTNVERLVRSVNDHLIQKLDKGCAPPTDTVFLHTAPHHDDIMLGYLPYVVRSIRDPKNTHHFAYMTSGFTAVTNAHALSLLKNLLLFQKRPEFLQLFEESYFDANTTQNHNRDVWQYLDGVAADDAHMKQEGEARRTYRILKKSLEESDPENLEQRIRKMIHYFETQYAGKKDLPYIQKFKGMIREWEADCLWGYLGFDASNIHHLRLGFYKGDIFTEEPTIIRDVLPILHLLRKVKPDVVSVALDPEASGPDTHYKVMQAVAEALRDYEKESGRSDIRVLGYRNVWYRFHPAEADIIVPVSLNMLAIMENAFVNAFVSQKNASFPSYEYDGPFSGLARRIQVEQYQMLKTCLGRRYFNDHPSALVRAARGVVFLRDMSLKEFYTHARELKKITESEETPF